MSSIPVLLDKAEILILCRAGILLESATIPGGRRAGILFLYYSIKITGAAASTYSLVQADPTGIQVVVADPTGKTDFTGWTAIQKNKPMYIYIWRRD